MDATIAVKCPGCGQDYGAKPSQAGRTLSCRKCGASIEVPDPSVGAFSAIVVDEEDAPPVVASVTKPRSVAPPPPRPADLEGEPQPWFYTAGVASAWILLGLAMIGVVGWLAILGAMGALAIDKFVAAVAIGLAAVVGCSTLFILADVGLTLRAMRREMDQQR